MLTSITLIDTKEIGRSVCVTLDENERVLLTYFEMSRNACWALLPQVAA